MDSKLTGVELIAQERKEQIEKHGRTVAQDVEFNGRGQLIEAAMQLIKPDNKRNGLEKAFNSIGFTAPIGWDVTIFSKMMAKPYEQRIIIAATLIAAEYDRREAFAALNTQK